MLPKNERIINIETGPDLDKPIYRVYNYDRLVALFKSGNNTLVKPALWDDPLENFILKTASAVFKKHPEYDLDARDRFYGQCWSLLKESDAMWRIYSPDKKGVKVKTTIRKLFNSLEKSVKARYGFSFIGKVKYLSGEQLKKKLQNKDWLHSEVRSYKDQATSLLFKRSEFLHEHEVRLLFYDHNSKPSDEIFQYKIDPTELFSEIQFDPRITETAYKKLHAFFRNKMGYTKTISQSKLYQVPQLSFL